MFLLVLVVLLVGGGDTTKVQPTLDEFQFQRKLNLTPLGDDEIGGNLHNGSALGNVGRDFGAM